MVSNNINDVKEICGNGFVYVLLNDVGLLKIGITDNPISRFNTIQNASGSKIIKYYLSDSLKNNFDIEQHLHKRFKKYNTHAEWYSNNISFDDVIKYVDSYICNNGIRIDTPKFIKLPVNNISGRIIDISDYCDMVARLFRYADLMSIKINKKEEIIERLDEAIFKYETTLQDTDINTVDKVLFLANCSINLENFIFDLLKFCGTNNILESDYYYNFFNKYYNVQNCNLKNIHKKGVKILL